jgi:hypothetical protein
VLHLSIKEKIALDGVWMRSFFLNSKLGSVGWDVQDQNIGTWSVWFNQVLSVSVTSVAGIVL